MRPRNDCCFAMYCTPGGTGPLFLVVLDGQLAACSINIFTGTASQEDGQIVVPELLDDDLCARRRFQPCRESVRRSKVNGVERDDVDLAWNAPRKLDQSGDVAVGVVHPIEKDILIHNALLCLRIVILE